MILMNRLLLSLLVAHSAYGISLKTPINKVSAGLFGFGCTLMTTAGTAYVVTRINSMQNEGSPCPVGKPPTWCHVRAEYEDEQERVVYRCKGQNSSSGMNLYCRDGDMLIPVAMMPTPDDKAPVYWVAVGAGAVFALAGWAAYYFTNEHPDYEAM